ncbi:MAG: hypothetical protein U0V18_04505 [Anaerolineales bacterium]
MKSVISRIVLAVLVAALTFAAIPVTSAYAADDTPPAKGELTDEKMEEIWARASQAFERLGKAFEDTDAYIAKIQSMIDKAAANGKDVSSLQSALDAYKAALVASKPAYEQLATTMEAHAGFDANGKVTDSETAKATLKQVRDEMKALKESMGGTFKALREAVKAFREANKPTKEPVEKDS